MFLENKNFFSSPDRSGILFLAFSARKRFSKEQDWVFIVNHSCASKNHYKNTIINAKLKNVNRELNCFLELIFYLNLHC